MIKSLIHTSVQSDINFPSLPKEQTIKTILKSLHVHLLQFEKSFLLEGLLIQQEDDISRKLALYLDDKMENLLVQCDAKKGADFIIYVKPFVLSADPIFLMEAKRLPPTNNKDYVQGSTGGIERFKREQQGYGKHLMKSAMIGYIQQHSKAQWLEKVNTWVDEMIKKDTDLNWNKNDKLVADKEVADFISQHERVTQSLLTLYHFWLLLY